jgi:ATP-binding cassette subfamily C protein
MEMVECGAACLGILLDAFGRAVPLAELRRACGVSRDGSKASNVVAAARAYGLVAKGYKRELEELADLPYPYIVFWNFNHFVVVEGCRKGRVYLNDPATGPRTVSLEEFDKGFTGVVLSMQPGPEFTRGGRRPSVLRGVWRRLEPCLGSLLLGTAISLLLVLPGLTIAALMRMFIDDVLLTRHAGLARPIVLGLLAATIASGALTAMRLRLLRRLRRRLAVASAGRFVWHLLRLPADFYAQRYSGEIASRVVLNERIADLLSGRLASATVDSLMAVFYAAAMLRLDPALTAVAVGFAAIHVILLKQITRRRVDANLRLGLDYGKLAGVGIAGLRGIRTIKASGLESDFFARLTGHYARAVNTHQALALESLRLNLLPRFVSALMSAAILVVGGLRVIDGGLSIGTLVAFQILAGSFLAPVNRLLGLSASLQDLEGSIAKLDDVLENPPRREPPPESAGEPRRLEGRLEIRDLRFGYNPTGPPLLESLSLRLDPGRHLAMVGASGSGKSTIARLVAGLYEPSGGEIFFDGRPAREVAAEVRARSLALVDQEIVLFAGTVRENLTLWDPTIPEDRMVRACRDAEIHDDILSLPNGYDTPLLEGAANLSGGQRQRLEIARALCFDPALLILDEATSALDAETELRIGGNLRRRGCACILVAHRLSTIREAEEILVLERGRVAQRGTYDALRAAGGAFADLLAFGGLSDSESAAAGHA